MLNISVVSGKFRIMKKKNQNTRERTGEHKQALKEK
jgi:hypothetical protein